MRFQSGQSGNPAGRPLGSRNKATLALEAAFEERAEEIVNDVVERAKNGQAAAMRLCMDRLLAPKRHRPVAIDLPVIETPADARKALAVVTAELAQGNLTIPEATGLIALIDRMLRLADRIGEMERVRREEERVEAAGRRVRETFEALMAQDETPDAVASAEKPAAPLYSPVNSQISPAAEPTGASPGGDEAVAQPAAPREEAPAPLLRAA